MKTLFSCFAALLIACSASTSSGQVIAFEDFDADLNLLGFSDNIGGGFSSLGDGFGEYTRLVSSSIPFNISDDSVTGGAAGSNPFSADVNGFLGDENNNNTVFAITDTWNDDTGNAEVNGTWSFDISSATGPLQVQADFAAFNDYAGSTVNSNVDFFYQIDSGGYLPLFTSVIDLGGSRTSLMDLGTSVTYDDPVNMLSNDGTLFILSENFSTAFG